MKHNDGWDGPSLLETFRGEYIILITKIKTKEVFESEEGLHETNGQVVLRGFLLDYDDTYFYLGDTSEFVTQAVERHIVAIIQLEKKHDLVDDIFDNMEIPKRAN